ncbi:unnamed protein product [Cylicostephanus goldi]|uniref:Reverse transcriptase domain-containing protein n=1 Tax=Cylicostephanus goldi TaxID=71465 RepID=A0A3P6RLK2_CYLGO|nr:unnamed protein product [Cylicostephanus goldi]
MAQGLKGAPGTFQRVANALIRELKACCFAYIDDIIIASHSVREHLQDLEEVFVRIQNFGMKLTSEKCSFFKKEVQYLGILVSKKGTRLNPEKVASIVDIAQPTDAKGVKSFLGAASYFRRFIPRFSFIATPLNNLLQKEVPFTWTEEHTKAFLSLKKALVNAPVLVSPVLGRPYHIHTDASTIGVGACLLQENPETGNQHPIAYCSRPLTKHEKNYAVIELEALAIVFALNHFYPYVANAKITLVTDHAPLKSLMHRSDLVGRLAKYQISIQAFDLEIVYRAGKHNTLCDFLSRYPVAYTNAIQVSNLPSLEDIRQSQMQSNYRKLIDFLRGDMDNLSDEFSRTLHNYSIFNDCLYFTGKESPQLIIPDQDMQKRIIEFFHNNPLISSHAGMRKTQKA